MSALIAFLISAAIAVVLVAFLRQRQGRERFDKKTFVRRSAGAFSVTLIVGVILGLIIVAWLVIAVVSNLSG